MKTASYITGRPKELYVLDYGLFKVHSNGRVIGIVGFLIVTDAGERILVDTGFPVKYAEDGAQAAEEDRLGEFGVVLSLDHSNMPKAQLAKAGVSMDQIDLLIITHTHIDHVGGIADFPQAPIVMARAERALDHPLYWGDVRPIDWPDRDYLLVDEDCEIGRGFQILFVPGHAPGQLAIMLDLPETGAVLLTSDAISRPSEIDEAFAGSWNEKLAIEHGARLMALAQDRDAMVIYGHCPDQWPGLRKAPEAFR